MGRVEVVVRFAGDLLDVIQLPAGDTYWLGMTPIKAVAGVDVTIGLASVTVSRAPTDQEVVPRRAIEVRPYVYGAASLAGQLALLLIAFWTATSEPDSAPAIEANNGQRGAMRIKRFAVPAQTIERTPDPAPAETPITTDATPEQTLDLDTPAPQELQEFVPSEMSGGGLDVEGPKDGDGASKFDPSTDPAFDSIKVGDYSTLATGRSAGEGYGPLARNSSLVVITCDRASCLVVGGEKAVRVRKAVNERLAEITDCYKRAALSGGGKVEIDFQVDAAGGVDDLEIGDADPAGACVARILKTLQIDAADEAQSESAG